MLLFLSVEEETKNQLITMKHTLEIVAGPCSAESRDQMLRTATSLKKMGINKFRAGLWKPRSRAGGFEGVGEKGLEWLLEIQQTLNMEVYTEVALPNHVEAVLKADLDGVWIGARTTVNPFLMTELASALQDTKKPVWVKNPIAPDLRLWIGGIERLYAENIKNVKAIHRGFLLQSNEPYRNTPLWDICRKLKSTFPNLAIYCDPSHIAGRRDLIHKVCEQALTQEVDGFIIESHYNPDAALSDSKQQLTPEDLDTLLKELALK